MAGFELAMAGFDELAYRHKAQPVDRSVYARLVRPKLSTTLAAASNMQGAPAIDAFHHFWNGTVNLTVNEQDSSGPKSGTLKVAVIYATLPDNDSKEMRFGVLFRLEKAATMPTVSTQMQPGAGPLRAFTQRITEALETRLAHWAYREYAAGRFELNQWLADGVRAYLIAKYDDAAHPNGFKPLIDVRCCEMDLAIAGRLDSAGSSREVSACEGALAAALEADGQHAAAAELYLEAARALFADEGEEHRDVVLGFFRQAGLAWTMARRWDEGESAYLECLRCAAATTRGKAGFLADAAAVQTLNELVGMYTNQLIQPNPEKGASKVGAALAALLVAGGVSADACPVPTSILRKALRGADAATDALYELACAADAGTARQVLRRCAALGVPELAPVEPRVLGEQSPIFTAPMSADGKSTYLGHTTGCVSESHASGEGDILVASKQAMKILGSTHAWSSTMFQKLQIDHANDAALGRSYGGR